MNGHNPAPADPSALAYVTCSSNYCSSNRTGFGYFRSFFL
jgi:hypothetical protein